LADADADADAESGVGPVAGAEPETGTEADPKTEARPLVKLPTELSARGAPAAAGLPLTGAALDGPPAGTALTWAEAEARTGGAAAGSGGWELPAGAHSAPGAGGGGSSYP
jgi:hypothetical protein